SRESRMSRSIAKPGIWTTQSRPSASNSARIGASAIGSAAASSTRQPGAPAIAVSASSGGRAGAGADGSSWTTGGGHACCWARSTPRPTITTAAAAAAAPAQFRTCMRLSLPRERLLWNQPDDPARRVGRQRHPGKPRRVLQRNVEVPVGPLNDVAHPAELVEDDLLVHDLVTIGLEPLEPLADEAADEQARVLPARIPVAGVEADAGRRHRRRPVDDRVDHSFGRGHHVRLHALGRDAPAVVATLL